MNKITFSVDVEQDLHLKTYNGITLGLRDFEKLCGKHKIKPVLFVTGDCIKKHPEVFRRLSKKGWEISSHGLTHDRFDEMSTSEKEVEIKKSILNFKKYLNIRPKGFRAPQHSIDSKTLDLLEKYNFEYDSSYTPLNFFQLFFFPTKFSLWFESFFSPLNKYNIRKKLIERPTSSFFIPFVSLTVRILPYSLLYLYVKLIRHLYREPMFYIHSWDLIELKGSRIDRAFPHTLLLKKLDYIMSLEKIKD